MTKSKTLEAALNTEHDAIIQAELDEPGSEQPGRTNRIENFYIGDYTLLIPQNLRFYKRRKGRQAGKYVAVYVNPKTGRGMANPTKAYIAKVNEKLDNMRYTVDQTVLSHWKEHIRTKILKNQKETIKRLAKEKEKQ